MQESKQTKPNNSLHSHQSRDTRDEFLPFCIAASWRANAHISISIIKNCDPTSESCPSVQKLAAQVIGCCNSHFQFVWLEIVKFIFALASFKKCRVHQLTQANSEFTADLKKLAYFLRL